MTGQLAGKRGLIMGVANERSIAWGIAKSMYEAGAELAFTYQGEAFGKRLAPLAASVGSDFMVDVDVTDDASLQTAFDQLEVVHADAHIFTESKADWFDINDNLPQYRQYRTDED